MNIKKFLIITLLVVPIIALGQTNVGSGLDSNRTTSNIGETEPVKIDNVVEPNKPTQTLTDSSVDSSLNTETVTTTTKNRGTSEEEQIESVRSVTQTVKEINDESKRVESDVRAEIKSGIDKSILNIRTQVDIEAYELQNVIDDTRNNIFEEVRETIKQSSPINSEVTKDLEIKIEDAARKIEAGLEEKSGVDVDFSENIENINNTLLRYKKTIDQKRQIIEQRGVDLIEKDTDNDGLSDYDEVYIYNTDPTNAFTVDGEKNDAEKVASGINPTSLEEEPIEYEDPRIDEDSVISDLYTVNKVEIIKEEKESLKIKGTGLPNSYLTIYVYSTPIIVTVKTDNRGEWEYTLEKELENGEHNIYVATVNNSGKLIARSDAVPFSKTAEAASLGSLSGIGEISTGQNDFVSENFALIILAILFAAILITLIFTGNKKKEVENFLDETKNSV